MNCRRVQKLLPLYAEDDLESSVASRIATHLEWCGRCNWLADDYNESQSWLRSSTPPEFNKALLDGVKNGVLTEIAATRQKPSMLALLAQHWNRRPVLALSAAALMIFGTVVLYVYQGGVEVNPSREVAKEELEGAPLPGKTVLATSTKAAPGARSQELHLVSRNRRRVATHLSSLMIPVEKEPHILSEVVSQSPQTVTRAGPSTGSKETLRIEIQTSDPLIRIIWFAPQETDSHQSKPATD